MADELKTGEEKSQIEETKIENENTVTMSQEKLDELINSKFKKGAEKSTAKLLETLGVDSLDDLQSIVKAKAEAEEAQKTELQKAQEAMEAARLEKENLLKEKEALERKNAIQSLAVEHGIKEVDYFELELKKRSGEEGFDSGKFIETLKEEKPFIFGQTIASTPPRTDTTGNISANPNDFKSQLEGMTLNQLKELQKKL